MKKSNLFKKIFAISLACFMLVGVMPSLALDALAGNVQFDGSKTATELVNSLLGSGITASNVTSKGSVKSFSGGASEVGIESGISLDTSYGGSSENDSDLASLMDYDYGGHTSSVQFDMTATGNLLNFNYAFASGEFDQEPQYNDVFGLFVSVNGGAFENIAKIDNGSNVNITNLKNTSSYTAKSLSFSGEDGDGISKVFNAHKSVNVGDHVVVKFVIADVSDQSVDSYVFIESGSLSFTPPGSLSFTPPVSETTYSKVDPKAGFITNITRNNDVTNKASFNSNIKNTEDYLKEALGITDAQKSSGVNVWLEVEDMSSKVTAEEKSLIDTAVNKAITGGKVGMYLDVDLFLKETGGSTQQIHETSKEITISFTVPDELVNSDGTLKRHYYLVRIHNGVPTVIEGTYDADTKTITFTSDKFSTYALVYQDESIAPKTGDSGSVYLWILLMIAGLGVAGAAVLYSKKRI